MKEVLYVFIGGGLGCSLRYLTSSWLSQMTRGQFPIGTLTVNLVGCLLIGFLVSIAERFQLSNEIRLLLVAGLCGGFTTFSTFGHDGLLLLRNGHLGLFILYASVSMVFGILLALLGGWLGMRCFN